jgi:hypothetical protein
MALDQSVPSELADAQKSGEVICEAGTDVEGKAYQGDCYSGPVDDPTSEADWAPDIPV